MAEEIADGEFAFEIHDVFQLGDGYEGDATLVGPPLSVSAGLAIGDTLNVPTTVEGTSRLVTCVEFPLVNLGPDRLSWVRVSVMGIRADDVRVGGRAIRAARSS